MTIGTDQVLMITDEAGMKQFADENRDIDWLCFDTEFIGEKRFETLICLIQVATEHGYYFIDPLKVRNLDLFLDIIEDPEIVKITHAGENDYRLLNAQFNVVPKNVLDTQIISAFAGYKFPVSFGKLVESELKIRLKKGYAVADWMSRPIKEKQLKYALDDVLYLKELMDGIIVKTDRLGRTEWALAECRELEKPEYYFKDPNKEFLGSNLVKNLKTKEKLLLLRLTRWREDEARARNYSKDMILSSKLIGQIIRSTSAGRDALLNNRRLPQRMMERHADMFLDMIQGEGTEEEMAVLAQIPRDHIENPRQDLIMEMLSILVKYKCLDANLTSSVVMPRSFIKKMKTDDNYFPDKLEIGWRREFLGEELILWFRERNKMKLVFKDGEFSLTKGE